MLQLGRTQVFTGGYYFQNVASLQKIYAVFGIFYSNEGKVVLLQYLYSSKPNLLQKVKNNN